MTTIASTPAAAGDLLAQAHAQGRLQNSVDNTLRLIAATCAEREAAPVRAARQHLAAAYRTTRLRRRLERETLAG